MGGVARSALPKKSGEAAGWGSSGGVGCHECDVLSKTHYNSQISDSSIRLISTYCLPISSFLGLFVRRIRLTFKMLLRIKSFDKIRLTLLHIRQVVSEVLCPFRCVSDENGFVQLELLCLKFTVQFFIFKSLFDCYIMQCHTKASICRIQ